jgi:predicted nucleic acid-binding protein
MSDRVFVDTNILVNAHDLMTEDMADGQKIEGIRIVNHFVSL